MTLKYFYESLKKYSNLFTCNTIDILEKNEYYISNLAENFKECYEATEGEKYSYMYCILLLINNFENLEVKRYSEDTYSVRIMYSCMNELILDDIFTINETNRKRLIMKEALKDFCDLVMYSDDLLNYSKSLRSNTILFKT